MTIRWEELSNRQKRQIFYRTRGASDYHPFSLVVHGFFFAVFVITILSMFLV